MKTLRAFSLALALTPALAVPQLLHAQSPRISEIVEARMKPGWQTDAGTYIAALHLSLAQDWITYWRHPGESGIAPRFDWSESDNLSQARVHWPEPRLFMSSGFHSIGYAGEVVLPIEVTPQIPGTPVELVGIVKLGVCDDICIPADLPLRLTISGEGARVPAIEQALDSRPRAARAAGLRDVACTVEPHSRGLRLSAALELPRQGDDEFVLVEMTGPARPSRALSSSRNGSAITGESVFQMDGGAIDRSSVRVSVVSEDGMLVHQGCSLGN
ncbi:MAG: hypothetical protein JJU09_12425 [Rhodobacteraceae bacterium]|nr:hypothetical protein [Paracoccaceae bacterium]